MSNLHQIVIVGAGLSGATLAERYACILNKKVLVIEKRDHIGGNCHDYLDAAGILVPKYGPHFFHTNSQTVWDYISQFTRWHPYHHRVLSYVGEGKYVPVPVNIDTVNHLFDARITDEAAMIAWLNTHRSSIENPRNSEESALNRVGKALYEKMFKHYTKKQWDKWPTELDASVMDRIPVRTNFEDRYFTDAYQGVPQKGYTETIATMLHHPNITIHLNSDFMTERPHLQKYEKLFYTGPIDQFFNYQLGDKLDYRSLRFEYETLNQEFFQSRAQINYPNTELFTRITEPKHATGQRHPKTTIIREYSTWEGEPYYPVPNARNQLLFSRYQQLAKRLESKGVYFVGRLANYKYFNMDQAIENALNLFDTLEVQHK